MTRFIAALLAIIVSLSIADATRAADPTPPAAPTALTQTSGGTGIPTGGWTRLTSLTLRFQITGSGSALTPQVELRPITKPLTGQPTSTGTAVIPAAEQTQIVSIVVGGLRPKTSYAWQARVVDASGLASTWTAFGTQGAGVATFTVDTTPPAVPSIKSPTNPHSGWWYNTRMERFTWTSTDSGSGIAGYSYRVDQKTSGSPDKLVQQTSIVLSNLKDGKWVLHVWARDRAGNWSRVSLYRFNLDTTAPKITYLWSSNHTFNPYTSAQIWRYSISESAHIVINIRRSHQTGPVLVRDLGKLTPGTHDFTWNGRTSSGAIVPGDWYWFHVFATDGLGNSANNAFGGIHVSPIKPLVKRIVISLSRQTITAYQDGRVIWSSLATTGNFQITPTPAGHYAIFARYSPYEFVSPWPPGSPLWYAPAWSTYAMEFIGGGYFIHDAPWRSVFGPASQAGGQPGTNYGGTHGCVNVPFSTAQFLWNWAPMGTTVDVVG